MAVLKPVLICQAVDQDDPVSATLVRWIRTLAADPSVASVRVLALRVGRFELPDNVAVVGLGTGKYTRLMRFFTEVVRAIQHHEADFFFVLQGGPYPALLLPVKLLTGRRVYQWKTHSHVDRRMAFYARWCDDLVFTATLSSFPLALPNVRVVGHGIDMEQFRPAPAAGPPMADLIAVGRVAPVKRLDRVVSALASCREETGRVWSLDICGPALEGDREYRAKLEELIAQLGASESVRFLGPAPHDEMGGLLGCYRAAVNFSDTGFDKAIAEAMACGRPVVSTNACFAELLPDDLRDLLVVDHDDVIAQARGITRVLELDEPERRDIGDRLRAIVAEHHGLAQFWGKILSEIGTARSGDLSASLAPPGALP